MDVASSLRSETKGKVQGCRKDDVLACGAQWGREDTRVPAQRYQGRKPPAHGLHSNFHTFTPFDAQLPYLVAEAVSQDVGVESGGGAGKSQLLPPWPRARQRPALGGGGADLEVEAGAVAGGGGERTQTPRDVVHVVESQELRVQSVV